VTDKPATSISNTYRAHRRGGRGPCTSWTKGCRRGAETRRPRKGRFARCVVKAISHGIVRHDPTTSYTSGNSPAGLMLGDERARFQARRRRPGPLSSRGSARDDLGQEGRDSGRRHRDIDTTAITTTTGPAAAADCSTIVFEFVEPGLGSLRLLARSDRAVVRRGRGRGRGPVGGKASRVR